MIPSTLPPETVATFGSNVPMNARAQPAELATAYVMLADSRSCYKSGATIAVTGGSRSFNEKRPGHLTRPTLNIPVRAGGSYVNHRPVWPALPR